MELDVHTDNTNGMTDGSHAESLEMEHCLSELNTKLENDFLLLEKVSVRFYSAAPTLVAAKAIRDLGWTILPEAKDTR